MKGNIFKKYISSFFWTKVLVFSFLLITASLNLFDLDKKVKIINSSKVLLTREPEIKKNKLESQTTVAVVSQAETFQIEVPDRKNNIEQEILSLMNKERELRGVSPFRVNGSLNASAYKKAQDMISKNYWAHSYGHEDPWRFMDQAGYRYTLAGENLAKDYVDSNGVVMGWMGSEFHRNNILNSNYKDVGVAVVEGNISGQKTMLVVLHLGSL